MCVHLCASASHRAIIKFDLCHRSRCLLLFLLSSSSSSTLHTKTFWWLLLLLIWANNSNISHSSCCRSRPQVREKERWLSLSLLLSSFTISVVSLACNLAFVLLPYSAHLPLSDRLSLSRSFSMSVVIVSLFVVSYVARIDHTMATVCVCMCTSEYNRERGSHLFGKWTHTQERHHRKQVVSLSALLAGSSSSSSRSNSTRHHQSGDRRAIAANRNTHTHTIALNWLHLQIKTDSEHRSLSLRSLCICVPLHLSVLLLQ